MTTISVITVMSQVVLLLSLVLGPPVGVFILHDFGLHLKQSFKGKPGASPMVARLRLRLRYATGSHGADYFADGTDKVLGILDAKQVQRTSIADIGDVKVIDNGRPGSFGVTQCRSLARANFDVGLSVCFGCDFAGCWWW